MRGTLYIDPIRLKIHGYGKKPIPGHKYLMSIDCSRGDAADRTAIEILDMDGIDDDGTPCLEQGIRISWKNDW